MAWLGGSPRLSAIGRFKRLVRVALYALQINRLLVRFCRLPLVLGFHRVKAVSDSELDRGLAAVNPKAFAEVISYVKKLGYEYVPLASIRSGDSAGVSKLLAAVTFDDGFKDLYEIAYPVLNEHEIPFTLFLTTSTLGASRLLWLHRIYAALDLKTSEERARILRKLPAGEYCSGAKTSTAEIIFSAGRYQLRRLSEYLAQKCGLSEELELNTAAGLYLSREEVKEMMANGLSVEAHSHEHWPPSALSVEEMEAEIQLSREIIFREFGARPSFFCLPYGRGMDVVFRTKVVSELAGVCTTRTDLVREENSDREIPRIMVYTDAIDFAYALTHCLLPHLWPLERNAAPRS